MIKNISNLGDAAIYCDFGSEVNEKTNLSVISYFNNISRLVQENKISGINNITPSYNKLIISFDLTTTNYLEIKDFIVNLEIKDEKKDNPKAIKIAVCCEDEFGLDFNRLTEKLKLTKKQILELYLNKQYFCYMTGFIAGMPFLGHLAE